MTPLVRTPFMDRVGMALCTSHSGMTSVMVDMAANSAVAICLLMTAVTLLFGQGRFNEPLLGNTGDADKPNKILQSRA